MSEEWDREPNREPEKKAVWPIYVILSVMVGIFVYGAMDMARNQATPDYQAVTGGKDYSQNTATAPPAPSVDYYLTSTAAELYAIYDRNEVRADSIYKGQRVAVSGVVSSIGKDILGSPYVSLEGAEGGIFGVQCVFPTDRAAALLALNKGDEITVVGKVDGKMMNVVMRDCRMK